MLWPKHWPCIDPCAFTKGTTSSSSTQMNPMNWTVRPNALNRTPTFSEVVVGHFLNGLNWETSELLQWRHDERDGVSNHQPHDCLLNRLFRCRSKKTSKLRVTGLCGAIHRCPVNSFTQRACNVKKCFLLMTSSFRTIVFLCYGIIISHKNIMVNFDLTFNRINIYQFHTTAFSRDFMLCCINFSRGLHIFGPCKSYLMLEIRINIFFVIIYTHNSNILSEVLTILWSCNPCLNDKLFLWSRGSCLNHQQIDLPYVHRFNQVRTKRFVYFVIITTSLDLFSTCVSDKSFFFNAYNFI